ncbi:hypothetical protein [Chlorogloeopsis sp. ULAP02]|uniref:hypothetical protein n=1 Tax=Chlorogloeopsis sp. ULAP02 TaxID=3107926 RepID=UPI00313651D9
MWLNFANQPSNPNAREWLELGAGKGYTSTSIPNRLVWVAEIDAPNRLELPQKGGQRVKFRKSKILITVDGETGARLGTDIFELP